ncbi:MAG: hypothetical protein CL927_11025, partial [Deltaproteobacteria bacterium]|nr:hypothetical protein [Deltaproteobacteria bacterium]HCH61379.1 hypothetical protein [Deltaproteobacteria bacterium]
LADDADATVDPGSFFSWYIDSDSDNYGDEAATPVGACGDPSTSTDRYALNALDCNDAESAINPAATEICDAADTDEDCDGLADDADPSVDTATGSPWYPDEDDDGYGTDDSTGDLFCDDPGTGYDATADDCDDNDASVNPGATEVCNDTDDDCDPTTGQAGMAQFVDSSNAATDLQATFAAGTPSSLASWTSSTDGTLWMCEGTWYAQLEIATNHTVDILGPDGAAVTILDGNYQDSIVYLNEGSDVYMSGLTIQYGYAYGGGGLVVDQGSFTGEDLIFEENYATYGGAFLTSDAAVSFEDSTFSANAAYYGGAGLVADDGSHKVSFSDCTFDGNDSYDNGGGLHFFDSPEVMVTDTTFVDNFAVNDGGGIYVDEGTLFVDSCEFDGNLSDHDGGGIYAADDISIVDTLFIDNEAGDDGGGVYLTLGRFETATISGSSSSSSGASSTVFSGNMADDNGEAVYIRIADDWFNGGELQVDDVDFGSDDLYHRTASWASFSPGSAASFTCTHWYNCY